jgi:NAD(P)-dependent dehydrogenase (short-subunit alcohol dehydrogenase family)
LETTFALNHISYFLLTHLLLDLLKASTPSRIINVSSDAHQAITKLDFDNLQAEKGFNVLTQYSLSKFENILFTYELARRLEGTGVTANALHPGLVRTGFGRNDNPIIKLFMMGLQLFAKNAKQGAETSIYLASSPDVATINGKYFVDYKERRSNDASYNREYQKRLWEISEQITGVHEIS